jgi:hypothetical protein
MLLCEFHFNTDENYILPKTCMLQLLRFTKEDDKDTKNEPERWTTSSQFSLIEPSRRTSYIFLFPKSIEVHEYMLERS